MEEKEEVVEVEKVAEVLADPLAEIKASIRLNSGMSAEELNVHYPELSVAEILAIKNEG
jgi:hypothetical protein